MHYTSSNFGQPRRLPYAAPNFAIGPARSIGTKWSANISPNESHEWLESCLDPISAFCAQNREPSQREKRARSREREACHTCRPHRPRVPVRRPSMVQSPSHAPQQPIHPSSQLLSSSTLARKLAATAQGTAPSPPKTPSLHHIRAMRHAACNVALGGR